MEATHILLGRPWQYDHKGIHDGVTNKFMFVHRGQKVVLKPLLPKKVNKDKQREKKKGDKRMKGEVTKGTMRPKDKLHPKDTLRPKDFDCPKQKNEKKL
ncbi:hypothetical protein CR513_33497, partial [Mucuna pruriens]